MDFLPKYHAPERGRGAGSLNMPVLGCRLAGRCDGTPLLGSTSKQGVAHETFLPCELACSSGTKYAAFLPPGISDDTYFCCSCDHMTSFLYFTFKNDAMTCLRVTRNLSAWRTGVPCATSPCLFHWAASVRAHRLLLLAFSPSGTPKTRTRP